jgi:hypothetical protein
VSLRSTNAKAVAVVAGLLVVQALLVLGFVVPGHEPRPHDVPVGVVGPPAAAAALEARAPDALDARAYASQDAARAAIGDREVYGALVPAEGRLLVASAASPAVAQLLQAQLGRGGASVQDVAPLDEDDPRGATLGLLFLPLIVVCLPGALLLGALRLPARGLLGALALFAAGGGLLTVAAVQGLTGALPGSTWALAGVAALTILAIALAAAGFERALGRAGIGLAAVLFFLIGNPASGNATAPELLPGFWRAVGQLLPPGSGGTAMRNTAYFDGAALLEPLLVLGAWALLGAALVLVGDRLAARRRAAARSEEATGAPARPATLAA